MSAPQRVPLTKACGQCIKAKRKCSKGLPRCQRCVKQDLACLYKNAPLATTCGKALDARTPIAESTRSQSQSIGTLPSPNFKDGCTSDSFPNERLRVVSATDSPPSNLSCIQLAPPDVVMTLDEPTMNYLLNHLRGFTSMFSRSFGTPFIHRELYQDGLSPQLQNVFQLCYVHTHHNHENHSTISQAIASTASNLVRSVPSAHNFVSILELLQSLILLQIVTLLNPTASQILHKQAENRMSLLSSLTNKLFWSVPSYLPASLSPYRAWILAESVRRTLHMAHILQGVYSVMTRGHFILTAFVESLPLNQKSLMWDYGVPIMQNQASVDKETDGVGLETDLISYRELVENWDIGAVKRPRLFEEMLIVACKGATAVLENKEETIS